MYVGKYLSKHFLNYMKLKANIIANEWLNDITTYSPLAVLRTYFSWSLENHEHMFSVVWSSIRFQISIVLINPSAMVKHYCVSEDCRWYTCILQDFLTKHTYTSELQQKNQKKVSSLLVIVNEPWKSECMDVPTNISRL